MKSNRKRLTSLVLCTLACLAALAASFATGAEASPAWVFNGVELTGSETTLNHAGESSLTVPGLTMTCEPFVFTATISNSAGVGKASIASVPLSNCDTNAPVCEIETIKAETLPWSGHLTIVGGHRYLIIENLNLDVLYSGEECVLGGILAKYTGTAGGLIDNETESVTFDADSFTATKTELKALGAKAEWNGVFTMIGTGAHVGQSLTVS